MEYLPNSPTQSAASSLPSSFSLPIVCHQFQVPLDTERSACRGITKEKEKKPRQNGAQTRLAATVPVKGGGPVLGAAVLGLCCPGRSHCVIALPGENWARPTAHGPRPTPWGEAKGEFSSVAPPLPQPITSPHHHRRLSPAQRRFFFTHSPPLPHRSTSPRAPGPAQIPIRRCRTGPVDLHQRLDSNFSCAVCRRSVGGLEVA